MQCPKCQLEAYLDHVTRTIENGTQTEVFAYVCMNPQCHDYRKGFTASGEDAETKIKLKGE